MTAREGAPLRVLLSSHDGFGLGHARRNARLAEALQRQAPDTEITLVTGLGTRQRWLDRARWRVERVPELVKDTSGRYGNLHLPYDEALRLRTSRFDAVVEETRPHLVVVDRHPFGTDGELRPGLARARRAGAAVVLGLRDVLDDPSVVRAEVVGQGWEGSTETYDDLLVYGCRHICDHEQEYRLPLSPTYCGVVTAQPPVTTRAPSRPHTLVVSAGGGGDGEWTLALGHRMAVEEQFDRTILVTGPAGAARRSTNSRVEVVRSVPDTATLFAGADASIQMGGYNSTYEALVAGLRPILVPRRAPRREQAIRATRLAALGLVDVVDVGATTEEVRWLLARARRLPAGALGGAGVRVDGADVAARHLHALVGAGQEVVA